MRNFELSPGLRDFRGRQTFVPSSEKSKSYSAHRDQNLKCTMQLLAVRDTNAETVTTHRLRCPIDRRQGLYFDATGTEHNWVCFYDTMTFCHAPRTHEHFMASCVNECADARQVSRSGLVWVACVGP